jgi:hypothetical protein
MYAFPADNLPGVATEEATLEF